MKPHYIILIVFLVLSCCHQTWAKGIIFHLYRMQDNLYDRLLCLVPKDQTDLKIWTILDISITDLSDPKNKLKLASISIQQPDVWIQTERNLTMEVGGGVSRYEASLEIRFSKESSSDLDKYLCEVTYMNLAGSIAKIFPELEKANLSGVIRRQLTDKSQLIKLTQIKELQENLAETVNLLTNQTDERFEILSDRMESFELALSNISCLLGKDDNKKQDVSKPKPGHVIANDSFTKKTEVYVRSDKKKDGSSPTMDVKPGEITLGITESVHANCSFTVSSTSDMVSLITLTIARSKDSGESFQDLASITGFTPNIVNLLTTENFQANGFVNEVGESYIHLLWNYSMDKQGGLYQCSAYGIDITGKIMVMIDTTQVSADEANADDYAVKLQEMRNDQKNLEQTISHLNNYTDDLEKKLSERDNYTNDLEKRLSERDNYTNDLEKRLSERDNYTNDLEKRLTERDNYTNDLEKRLSERDNYTNDLEKRLSICNSPQCYTSKNFVELPVTYQSSKYYMNKGGIYNVQTSLDECQKCGGELIEINNEEEFKIIQGYLNTTDVKFVDIVGTDAEEEGKWVNQYTNNTTPYLNWGPSEPGGGTQQNCLFLYLKYQWKMMDDKCQWDAIRSSSRYICEVTST